MNVEHERRILIIGNSGNGKSACANTMIGGRVFESRASDHSVTKKSQFHMLENKDKQYLIVDTPSLFGPIINARELAKIIGITYPGFDAIIVVIKVGRFTEQEKNAFRYIERLFGSDVFSRMIILFTGLDNLEADNMSFHEYVRDHIRSELNHIVSKCGSRAEGFNNRADENIRNRQVQDLFITIEGVYERNRNKRLIYDRFWPEPERFFDREIKQREPIDRSKSKADLMNEIRRVIEKDDGHDENTNFMLSRLEAELNAIIEQSDNDESIWDCVYRYFNCVIL